MKKLPDYMKKTIEEVTTRLKRRRIPEGKEEEYLDSLIFNIESVMKTIHGLLKENKKLRKKGKFEENSMFNFPVEILTEEDKNKIVINKKTIMDFLLCLQDLQFHEIQKIYEYFRLKREAEIIEEEPIIGKEVKTDVSKSDLSPEQERALVNALKQKS